tara:strand:- start:221 stop:856 length:636 start_codon:yes stop_codon:yes gene_type:complete
MVDEKGTEQQVVEQEATPTDQDSSKEATLLGQEQESVNEKTSEESGESKPEEKAEEKAVPETYELKFAKDSLIEGEAHHASVVEFAKQNNFTNEQAQALLNRDQKLVSSYQDKVQDEYKQTVEDWKAEAEKDKEIGGDSLDASVIYAKRALERFGSDKFAEALESTGFGNHPEIIRIFSKIGRSMADDTLDSNKPAKRELTLEEKMYPHMS